MKSPEKILPCRKFLLVILFSSFACHSYSQSWAFRNGFGQNDNNTGFPDIGRAICTDASGNVYITGKISDALTGNTVSFGGSALVSAGDDDGFVAKFNSGGVHQWSLRFGGTGIDEGGFGIVTDGSSVYVTGETNGTMTVGTSATTYPVAGGGNDGFLMKLDAATGTSVSWVKRFGGANSDRGQALCLDPLGNIYVSGYFRTHTANPAATFGSFTRTVQGNWATYSTDLFVAKFDPGTGNIIWVSTGGDAGGNDNINGSGICYVPALSEVMVTGCYRSLSSIPGSTTAVYSTVSPASGVTLTNSNVTTNEDFCLLELNAADGTFLSGSGIGSGDGNEAGLGLTYDPSTGDVFFAGYFSSSSVTFPGNAANTNPSPSHDNILYGRYNPATDAYTWVKEADNSSPAAAADNARAIAADGSGGILITGYFRNTVTFPSGAVTFPGGPSITASGSLSDIFLARINTATGQAILLTSGSGNSTTADDIGFGVAYTPSQSDIWITGQYSSNITFSPLASLASSGATEDIVLACYNNPGPSITGNPSSYTSCYGHTASFSVSIIANAATLQWQESTDAAFTSPVTLSNNSIYSGVTGTVLTINDNSGLNGKYYRVVVTNSGGTVFSAAALLTVTAPSLPASAVSSTMQAGTMNNLYYGPSCNLVAKVLPLGSNPVSGNLTAQVWVEPGVPTAGDPFVQRHYQITPTAGTTATVTLYFTQAEFDNFNADPNSVLNLPTGPADAAGKANLRITKKDGSSNDGTGLPGSYTSGASVIDPPDANIVWNTAFNRWEVTFTVSGFSGFFVQTAAFVLPVKLVSFTANLAGDDVRLNWQTTAEENNDYFEIQRSTDGINFIPVNRIPGSNGTGTRNYITYDSGAALVNTSRIFYRLRMAGITGTDEYSHTIIINLSKKDKWITGISPNPFSDHISIGFNLREAAEVSVKIMDVRGFILIRKSFQVPKGFSTENILTGRNLPAGIYIAMIETKEKKFIYKLFAAAD